MAKKNPTDFYTDIDLHGNTITGAKTGTPADINDIANKGYVDSQFVLSSPDSQRLQNAKVDVGGIKEGETVHGLLLSTVLSRMLFPVVQPTHNEAVSSIEPSITKLLAGQKYIHKSKFNCTLNDRIQFESRLGCYCVYPDNNQSETNWFDIEDSHDVECRFPEVTIDTKGRTRFMYSVLLSRAAGKLNSHGFAEDESSFTASKRIFQELKYKVVLPSLYKISAPNDLVSFDITVGERLWSDVKRNMTTITDINRYVDGIDWTDISFILPINNQNQGSVVQIFVPGEPLSIELNGFDIIDCSVVSYKQIQLDEYSQPVLYAAIKFNSGTFAFHKAANVKVRYKSDGVFYNESTILIQQNSMSSSNNTGGAQGHVIVDGNGQTYPNRRKLKMMNVTVRDNDLHDETLVITPRQDIIDAGTYDN